jgi:hypothetical protein
MEGHPMKRSIRGSRVLVVVVSVALAALTGLGSDRHFIGR